MKPKLQAMFKIYFRGGSSALSTLERQIRLISLRMKRFQGIWHLKNRFPDVCNKIYNLLTNLEVDNEINAADAAADISLPEFNLRKFAF